MNRRTPDSQDAAGVPTSEAHAEPWLLLHSGPCPPAFNMAMDEALLEAVAGLGQPVLRFYSWTEPAATFGYFQHYAEIARTTQLRPLIRRPTGGGLVPHDADWTYSVVIPPTHPWHALNAVDSYRRMHEWIRAAFTRLGVATELANCCRKSTPGQCFVGWEKFDVLWQGRKIAGAAQRRNKQGLLIQGSVQPPPVGWERKQWEKEMAPSGHRQISLTAEVQAQAARLAVEKYSELAFYARR
ncbi:MAG: hypothetical protein EBY09_13390 [Verrucomicrobia bacterium]|nr:hypothetical protein [Verrucomicrobiota bacterium]NBU10537.1 hypothetical protein [Pseudomonadota bacterium]NDA67613.1 hypothetical protein [Verrucomicrobiota bacterium]NDE99037.1 hypothetical protein [Verrucomicrobiota bacterium]